MRKFWLRVATAVTAVALIAASGTSANASDETVWKKAGICEARGAIWLYTDDTRATLVEFLPINSTGERFVAPGGKTVVTKHVLVDGDPRPGATVTGTVTGESYEVEISTYSMSTFPGTHPAIAASSSIDWRVSSQGDGVVADVRQHSVAVSPAEGPELRFSSKTEHGFFLSGFIGFLFCTS